LPEIEGRREEPSKGTGVEDWMDRLAGDLGEQSMSPKEIGQVLKLAREVAHGVERKLAPLAAFIAGVHAGRLVAEGASREEALGESLRAAAALLPAEDSEEPGGSVPPGTR
jgi:hypothetical protein